MFKDETRITAQVDIASAGVGLRRFWMLGLLLAMSGCESSSPLETQRNPVVAPSAADSSTLRQSIDLLKRLEEFEQREAHRSIREKLQEWLALQPADPTWKIDPIIEMIPEGLQPLVSTERLSGLKIEDYDVLVLQEAVWLRDVARHVVNRSVLAPDLAELVERTIAEDRAQQNLLRQATQLFDWTTLNLQLDADVPAGDSHRFHSDVLLYPWESLLLGRGTVGEKSRVFQLLARQIGLRVVMLAIPAPVSDPPQAPTLWLPALHLGPELYLFDMRWGTPLLTSDGQRMATLRDANRDPAILQSLASASDAKYPVSADQLAEVIGLVDATPTELSQRMLVIEKALTGDDQLVLTTTPTSHAEDLGRCEGIHDVQLSSFPYEVLVRRMNLKSRPEAVQALAEEHGLFDATRTPLLQGRLLQFRGQFEATDDEAGAIAVYLEARTPDSVIRGLSNAPYPQTPGEAAPTADELARHAARIAATQRIMHRIKQNAGYWLGTIALEQGKYSVAIDYLENRLLHAYPDSPWGDGARFALGRALEGEAATTSHVDRFAKAAVHYREIPATSPYYPGCQWRAKRLDSQAAASSNPAAVTDRPSPSDAPEK